MKSLAGKGEDLSVEMRDKLPLPGELLNLLDPTFVELNSKLEMNELIDLGGANVRHHRTPEMSGKVALLHLNPKVLDYKERGRKIIEEMAGIFVRNFDVIFVFSDTQMVDMGSALARIWESNNNFKKAAFFGSYTINSIKERPVDERKKYIIKELALEHVLTIPGVSILLDDERAYIIDTMATWADAHITGEKNFFRTLVRGMNVPVKDWKKNVSDVWTGSAIDDARLLVEWAESKRIGDERFTGLACLLDALLNDRNDRRLRQILDKYQGR